MDSLKLNRRDMLLGAGAAVASVTRSSFAMAAAQTPAPGERDPTPVPPTADQIRRMKWWHEAKFGMFIHFGLYAQHARHEWAMETEAIPFAEYTPLAKAFHPTPGFARGWAKLAKAAGMKYMVMTTKHHEGFCNFDSKLTDYCATKQGPGRDLVREYVDAARAEGLHVGFYYSLMDWHHPDGARCATDEEARKRFVEYTHGLIRELLTNYGKIDVLWYDVSWPLDAKGWESERMNKMVFELQPDIVVNNRNHLIGDFSTPEQKIVAETNGRAWESCMTLNDSWGFQRADDNWKSARTVIRNLISCVHDGGNYLLNIGPQPDGSIPGESVRILSEVGHWMAINGDSIYKSEICDPRRSNYASFTRAGNTLFMHVHFWPGSDLAISGLTVKVKSARLIKTNEAVTVSQDPYRVHLTGLPVDAPDTPITTIALECDGEPKQDTIFVRNNKPRV
ncbi:MAG TPA: alpha-L-fucosidase [Acidobacteriaceae bacterium]